MKKTIAFVIACTLVLSVFTAGGWAQTLENTGELKITLPDYYKLDPELIREAKENREKVSGKEFKGNRGKSYMKPGQNERIEPLDVTTMEAKSIAILVDFPVEGGKISNVPGVDYERIPTKKFDDLLNGYDYDPFELKVFSWLAEYDGDKVSTDRTLRTYYDEVSYGQYQLEVEVVDWVTLSKPYEYYLGQDKGYYNENGDAFVGELVLEAVKLADENGVDFSEYAVGDEVPGIFIIHRGTGAEYSRDPEIIWSHKWDIQSARYFAHYYKTDEYMTDEEADELLKEQVFDGVTVNTYNIVPEVGRDISGYYYDSPEKPMPAYAGVYAHEFGHVLGLPDQYDYGYESEGTGMFTLMAAGSYGTDLFDPNDGSRQYRWYAGHTPTHIDGWSKWYLGFADPVEITENKSIKLRPVSDKPDLYKIVVPGSAGREYFLLENRQQNSFDGGLAYSSGGTDLHGLLVYHVVDNMIQKEPRRPNEAENWDINHLGKGPRAYSEYGQTHYGFSIIQADGMFDLEKANNDGDAGDVFPGINNVTSLSSISNKGPNTSSVFKWSKGNTETGINLTNIVEDEDGNITLEVVFTK